MCLFFFVLIVCIGKYFTNDIDCFVVVVFFEFNTSV